MKSIVSVVALVVCAVPPVAIAEAPVAGATHTFDGIEFCWIPAGTFTMGSFPHDHPDGDPERIHNEIPHSVTISQGFWMGKYEVTQEEWAAVMDFNPSELTGNDRLPVETVNWNDCQAFIKQLNEDHGEEMYRMPTEAEWEYACRAGTKTPYHFGHTLETTQANRYGGPDKTVAVGSYPPNAWNLHDMHGNVEEWCQDWYGEYTEDDQTDPKGPAKGESRVIRGGSWRNSHIFHRVSFRNGNDPEFRHAGIGIRLVRNADPVTEEK